MIKITLVAFTVFITQAAFAGDFNCQNLVEETKEYFHCQNSFVSYPEKVHFFYPKNLDSLKAINLNIHFHGHNIAGFDHLKNFGSMLMKSATNTVLVIPESVGKCETYDQFFTDKQRGISFIKELMSANEFSYAVIGFSGHSGAYRVLRTIFSYESLEKNLGIKVKGVGLFDATYSNLDSIVQFALENGNFIFFNSYVDGEKSTTDRISRELKRKYEGHTGFYFFPVKSTREPVLIQHFNILKNPGLSKYFELAF